MRAVLVLGDSLAVSPSTNEAFPALLHARIGREGLRYTVVNASVSGETSTGGLRRLEPLLSADVAVLVLELGANDALAGVEVRAIEQNLSAAIDAARQKGIRVLLCGMEIPPVHGLDYTIAFHLMFPRLAQQKSVPLVPFLLAGVALDPELNGPDAVHPNAAGAERIAETVWPYLRPLLQP